MDILCPNCGIENWLENQSQCLNCKAILRRCTDCSNYVRKTATCRAKGIDVTAREAEHPSLLSASTNCLEYRFIAQLSRPPGAAGGARGSRDSPRPPLGR